MGAFKVSWYTIPSFFQMQNKLYSAQKKNYNYQSKINDLTHTYMLIDGYTYTMQYEVLIF